MEIKPMTKTDAKKKATSNYIPPPMPAPSKAGRKVLQTLTEDLPVEMSPQERQDTGAQLAAQWSELSNAESHASEVKAELTSRRKAIEARIKSLSLQLTQGSKLKPLTVRVEADFENGIAEYSRLDTGEVIRSRPLADSERQEKIPFNPEDDSNAPLSDDDNPFNG